ncbi:MAG: thioredoxin family protein, partial [Pseudomonadota bacterium]|nr:thioredoxin family protein [Pseudomonadota bacterium]
QRHYNTRNMPGLQKEWGTRDVAWLSIDSSNRDSRDYKSAAQLNAWMSAHEGSQKAVLIDGDSATARLYAAKTTPHMFVINPEGRIVYAGAIDDRPRASSDETLKAKNYVRTALTAATGGAAVDPANTTPYGCSIAY